MNKRLKVGTVIVSASLIVLALLAMVPSGPFVHMRGRLVFAEDFGENTKICTIYVENTTYGDIAVFYENNEVDNIEVGEIVGRLEVTVGISKEYASTQAQAENWTRVYITIKNPADATVYENYLENSGLHAEYANHFEIWHRSIVTSFELTEGTWTVITKYEIYA